MGGTGVTQGGQDPRVGRFVDRQHGVGRERRRGRTPRSPNYYRTLRASVGFQKSGQPGGRSVEQLHRRVDGPKSRRIERNRTHAQRRPRRRLQGGRGRRAAGPKHNGQYRCDWCGAHRWGTLFVRTKIGFFGQKTKNHGPRFSEGRGFEVQWVGCLLLRLGQGECGSPTLEAKKRGFLPLVRVLTLLPLLPRSPLGSWAPKSVRVRILRR